MSAAKKTTNGSKSSNVKSLPEVVSPSKQSNTTNSSNSPNKKTNTSKTTSHDNNKLPEITGSSRNKSVSTPKETVVIAKVSKPSKSSVVAVATPDQQDVAVSDVTTGIASIEEASAATEVLIASDEGQTPTETTVAVDALQALSAAVTINGNGKVVLIYEQYNEQFDIVDGQTTQENVDEVYCLSFVMPNCLIHLSRHSPADRRDLEAAGKYDELYIKEEPRGVYHGLEAGCTYFVSVEQEADQLRRDQERMRAVAATMEGGRRQEGDGIVRDDGRVMESCSCIYGNPCVDEYGCKDWSNRAAVATKNGWKGF